MSKPEWGIKRICPSCGIKYYDFDKSPITCPKCKFEFDPDLLLKSRKGWGVHNKVEENNKNSVEEDKITSSNDEELENINQDEEIIDIDDNNTIETEIKETINEPVEQDIEENDSDIPFIEEELDENDISVEIEDKDDKSWF